MKEDISKENAQRGENQILEVDQDQGEDPIADLDPFPRVDLQDRVVDPPIDPRNHEAFQGIEVEEVVEAKALLKNQRNVHIVEVEIVEKRQRKTMGIKYEDLIQL